MNRPLFATVAVSLVVLGLLRLFSGGQGEAPVAPSGWAMEVPLPGPADVVPPAASAERSRAMVAPRVVGAAPEATSDVAVPIVPEAPVEESPVVLAGLVIDGSGAGVLGATVRVERHVADTGGFGMRSLGIEPLPELTTSTDAHGRFEARGRGQGEVVVHAAREGFVLREALTLALPATKLTLVLEPAGSLEVTVARAAHELAGMVAVEVRALGGERVLAGGTSEFTEGRALLAELRPGHHDVVVLGSLSRRVLHTVPGVQVYAGGTTRDPRLLDLDLRAWMQALRVTVVDPEGDPVVGAMVWVHHDFGESGITTGEDGSIVLVAGADGVDVTVRESGWRAARHPAITEDLVVRLERPLVLRLVRPVGRSASLGDLYLHVARVVAEGEPPAAGGNNDWSLSTGQDSIDIDLDGPGTYQVLWAAQVTLPGAGSANVFPRSLPAQVIEVPEDAGTKQVVLQLDAGAVDDLIARVATLTAELEPQAGETDGEHRRRVMQAILRADQR